jgi:hypothetical protein
MQKTASPNRDRISIVIATILLAYALTQLVSAPGQTIPISIGGIYLPVNLNFSNIVAVAVALITASGTDWILRDHPELSGTSTIPNLLLPATTSWVIYISMNNLGNNPFRWLIFIGGGIFLLVVILAEWTVLSSDSMQRPLAQILLTALAFMLLLALLITVTSAGQRLFITLPTITLAGFALSTRVIRLRIDSSLAFPLAAASTLVTIQLAAVLHYLPIEPLSASLLIFGGLYATINFSINYENNQDLRRALFEAGAPLVILGLIAIWLA